MTLAVVHDEELIVSEVAVRVVERVAGLPVAGEAVVAVVVVFVAGFASAGVMGE